MSELKPKITFEKLGLFGSLGNQMFQLAATLSLGRDLEMEVVIPRRGNYFEASYERIVNYIDEGLNLDLNYLESSDEISNTVNEECFNYFDIKKEIDNTKNTSIEGYFQSYKYFQHNDDLIKSKFLNFKPIIQSKTNEIAVQLPYNKELTAIHVRRGDYVDKQDYHTLLPISYYEAAKKEIGENQSYVVFSDDIDWCKSNFSDDHFFIESGNAFADLGLMACCDNFIIANSSFSWWGAWLAWNNKKKVIAPKNWFGPRNKNLSTKDLIPELWIQL